MLLTYRPTAVESETLRVFYGVDVFAQFIHVNYSGSFLFVGLLLLMAGIEPYTGYTDLR